MKEYTVGVFKAPPGCKVKYMAYTTGYNPTWQGCSEYKVEAASGAEAKKIAIKMHKEKHLRSAKTKIWARL